MIDGPVQRRIFGIHFCKSGGKKGTWVGPERYWQSKISDAGSTLELIFSSNEYPEEFDTDILKHTHQIYYHQ
jgi:hypothetical protein